MTENFLWMTVKLQMLGGTSAQFPRFTGDGTGTQRGDMTCWRKVTQLEWEAESRAGTQTPDFRLLVLLGSRHLSKWLSSCSAWARSMKGALLTAPKTLRDALGQFTSVQLSYQVKLTSEHLSTDPWCLDERERSEFALFWWCSGRRNDYPPASPSPPCVQGTLLFITKRPANGALCPREGVWHSNVQALESEKARF